MEPPRPNEHVLQALCNRGLSLHQSGRIEEARRCYESVLGADPRNFDALYLLGIAFLQIGQPERCIDLLGRATAIRPTVATAQVAMGNAFNRLGRHAEAISHFDRAIALQPGLAEAHGNRGMALYKLGRLEEALASYDRAAVLQPDHAGAYFNRGIVLAELRRFEDAARSHERAAMLQPGHFEAHNSRGAAMLAISRTEEALASFSRALALQPDRVEALSNQGVALYELGRLDEAMASYDRALALQPDLADIQFHQAMCRLKLGDYAAGWVQYEWRWRTKQFHATRHSSDAPLWLGREDLKGRTILLHAEQGFGDTLQFCRYAPAVTALGARVLLQVQPELEGQARRLPGIGQVMATDSQALPPHDFQTPLMSLPLAFETRLDSIPSAPYLDADPVLAAAFAQRMGPRTRPRVGLVWSGGFRPNHPENVRRNIPLELLEPLAKAEVEFFSLQKGAQAESELAELKAAGWSGPAMVDWTAELVDFADTAALIENLDLVIAVDTSTAHLAGGMGKPVWILNRFDCCWRWLAGRKDSPWYPSARLFTQTAAGKWQGVIGEVADELTALAAQDRPRG